MVPVPLKAMRPVPDQVVVADKVMLVVVPLPTAKVPVPAIVQVAPVVVIDAQARVPVNVIVGEPEALLIITASLIVGTEAPPEPPEVVDQFVVFIALQVPEPPRQYLSAI
jgi:hypothetical protein